MSSSNQRPANRGFRSVLRCAISHYRQSPSLSAPEPLRRKREGCQLDPTCNSSCCWIFTGALGWQYEVLRLQAIKSEIFCYTGG